MCRFLSYRAHTRRDCMRAYRGLFVPRIHAHQHTRVTRRIVFGIAFGLHHLKPKTLKPSTLTSDLEAVPASASARVETLTSPNPYKP